MGKFLLCHTSLRHTTNTDTQKVQDYDIHFTQKRKGNDEQLF